MNPLYWITWVARRRGYPGFEAVGPVCGLLSLAFGAAAMWLTFGAVRCGAWMPVILAVAASAFFGWIAKGGPWRKSDESAFGAYVATTGGLPGVAGALVAGRVDEALRIRLRLPLDGTFPGVRYLHLWHLAKNELNARGLGDGASLDMAAALKLADEVLAKSGEV